MNPQVRIAGLIEGSREGGAPCGAAHLHSLADGRSFAIFEELGSGSAACSLNAEGVIEASERACRDIARGCDLVLLSKFGKLEAESRSGLIPAFVAAMEAGIPILTSVSPRYEAAWSAFAAPLFTVLPPTGGALDAWWTSVYQGRK